jgi:branched-chain amino acid transport system ATP-binding protein
MGLLKLQSVSKSYGALQVIHGVSFSVTEGETLGILGPNGAGKTTLFNLISGDVACDSGQVNYRGRDITQEPAHQRCRAGRGAHHERARSLLLRHHLYLQFCRQY